MNTQGVLLDYNRYKPPLFLRRSLLWLQFSKQILLPLSCFNTEHGIKKYLSTMRLADFDRSDFQKFINDYGK